MPKVVILGDGGWGTTLAILLFNKGYQVTLWSHDSEYASFLDEKRENIKFFPGIKIPAGIKITSCTEILREEIDFVVIAVPSVFFRSVLKRIQTYPSRAIFVSVAKGMELNTFKRMSEIIAEEVGEVEIAVLSGPSIAYEVAKAIPTSVVAASENPAVAKEVQNLFMTGYFRVYTSQDVMGVELGGALKNIIALAAGICDGLGFGSNSKAALLSRGLLEMVRFGKILGAQPRTFFGLSGLGDMITTCFSLKSRNRYLGEEIAKGRNLEEVLQEMEMVAEGAYTVKAVYEFSKLKGIEMPISEKIYQVLYLQKDPREAVEELMRREPKPEMLPEEI